MTDEAIAEWVESVVQDSARFNVVFVQLGDAFPLSRQALRARVDSVVEVHDYLDGISASATIRVVTGLEALATRSAPNLGRLRDRVFEDCDQGSRVVLLSRRPRSAYPAVPGSSVLLDAKLVVPPIGESGDVDFGLEALSAGTPAEIVLAQALRELGEAGCASLDAVMYEDGLDDASRLNSLDPGDQEALLSSGLACAAEGVLRWSFPRATERVRVGLAEVVAGMRFPQPTFAIVAERCWAVERLIKQALRARARALWQENWKEELLAENERSLALCRANTGTYTDVRTVRDLRDPLEWLTLAETLEVRAGSEVGGLGVIEEMWAKLRAELLPVKDRVERSQLLRKRDADIAGRWSTLLSGRLSTSGSPDPALALASAPSTQKGVMQRLRAELGENPAFAGDVEKDLMSLVTATVRFIAHTLDARPTYAAAFGDASRAPLERELQDAFRAFLDMSDLAGRVAVESSSIAGGRADVVLYLNDGTRFVTEVKRELKHADAAALEANYLPQTVAYQSANVPFGQLLVLDLTRSRNPVEERLDESMWVVHSRDEAGSVVASTLVSVVRGNRPTPSAR